MGVTTFRTYDTFHLAQPLPDNSVPVGTIGVVLVVHGGAPCKYEVEFPDHRGGNRGQAVTYTLAEAQMLREN